MSDKLVTKSAKEAKAAILSKVCDQIDIAKQENNDKIPYGFLARQLIGVQMVCPSITRDSIMNYLRKRAKQIKPSNEVALVNGATVTDLVVRESGRPNEVALVNGTTVTDLDARVSGRPKGTTHKRKRLGTLSLIAAKNDTAAIFNKEKEIVVNAGKRLKKG